MSFMVCLGLGTAFILGFSFAVVLNIRGVSYR